MAALLRRGNAGGDSAADHITTAQLAFIQVSKKYLRERRTLTRNDSAGSTHEVVAWPAEWGRRLSWNTIDIPTAEVPAAASGAAAGAER